MNWIVVKAPTVCVGGQPSHGFIGVGFGVGGVGGGGCVAVGVRGEREFHGKVCLYVTW
jgi:hypothetical protein